MSKLHIFILTMIVLLSSASGMALPELPKNQDAKIEFVSLKHDFGTIFRGQKVSHQFEFINSGNGILSIRGIQPACGCINARTLPKDEFAPGEKGYVEFEFDSTLFAGDVVRTLTVETNQPGTSAYVLLTVSAHIQEEITAQPSIAFLGAIDRNVRKDFFIQLKTAQRPASGQTPLTDSQIKELPQQLQKEVADIQSPIKILAVTTSSKHFKAALTTVKNIQKVTLFWEPSLPIGPFREKISVWSNASHLKELTIPVVGEVLGHVRPSHKYLEFGTVTAPDVSQKTLRFETKSKDFKIENITIEAKPPLANIQPETFLTYKVFVKPQGPELQFEMKVPNDLDKKRPINASGTITVKSNDADHPIFRIPFFGILKQE